MKYVRTTGKLPTLKDLNFRQSLELHAADRSALRQQLEVDTSRKFLAYFGRYYFSRFDVFLTLVFLFPYR